MPTTSHELSAAPAPARRSATWRPRYVELEGRTRLAAFETGRSDPAAPSILLVHGFGHSTQVAWDFVAAELEATHRVVAFDLPAFGASSQANGTYDLLFFTRATRAIVEAFGLHDFVLAGHSLGALVAAYYAALYPADVRSLVLLDPAGFHATPKTFVHLLGNRFVASLAAKVRLPRKALRRWFETAVYDPASIDEERHAAMYALSQDKTMKRGFARVYSDVVKVLLDLPALHAKLTRYRGPVLLMWGRHDRYVPLRALAAARSVYPQAAVAILERCGHCPSLEFPREVAASLRAGPTSE
ncbi:MAG TPA: alpha/beta fold hydrolase [Candidatus Baltobacteraceae bacterium]|nr:alpha/beta fold hydrolase [Candidatus Baltobacteraceae bacterium]